MTSAGNLSLPTGERACALLCLALVLPFSLMVLLDGSIAPGEYLWLTAAFAGVAMLMLGGAFVLFAFAELAKAGLASGWQASPRRALAQAFASRWREDRFTTLAWPLALFLLLLPSFNAFKQRILPRAGFLYDESLAGFDRALFGTDPGLLLHRLIGSPLATRFLDGIYHGWFLPTMLGISVVALCAGTRTRGQYMLAYAGIWILLGAVLAWWFPAAGPCFYEALADPAGAAPFRAVHEGLLNTGGHAAFLTSLGNQAYLLEHLGSADLVVGGGISAVPSVHNAMAVLFALAAFRVNALLGALATLFALLTWTASVYLNWHYAVDGLFGALGAVALWFAAGWIVDRVLARSEAAGNLQPLTA